MNTTRKYKDTSEEIEDLRKELTETRYQLAEATDTLDAIRSGNIDALVVKLDGSHRLYTLKSADLTYRIFIEQMTEGAITLNQHGHIVYSNSQFANLVNTPLEKVTGHLFCSFTPLQQQQSCRDLIKKAWDTNIRAETVVVGRDGNHIPVLLSLKTLDLDEGPSLSIIVTDLTIQKEVQTLLLQKNTQLEEAQQVAHALNANLEKTVKERTKALEETVAEKSKIEKRLTQILETMAEGVGIFDVSGNITYANPMARKLLGLTQQNGNAKAYPVFSGQNLKVDGTPLPEEEHPINISIRAGRPLYDHEIAIERPGRERSYISINAAPISDSSGMVIAGIGTFMDVTNRRKAIQQKDDFISVASHELRTPIATLKASLQLLNRLKGNPGSSMLPTLVEQSNKSLDKVSRLINDLLNTSKMAEGQLHLNRKYFNLSSLLEESFNQMSSFRNQRITTRGDMSLGVYADPDRIEQVVTNIINNAFKYAPDSKDVLVELSRAGHYAKVAIRDKGKGIPDEKLPYLFDRYYRVDDKGNQYSGLGLGLYICAEIIRKHGGKIGAESELGNGSTFWFTLPLEKE